MNKQFSSQAGAFLAGSTEQNTPKKKTRAKQAPIKADNVPEGYILKPEPKTKHLNLLLQQSVYDRLKERAQAEGTSVNDLANKILKEATI